MTDLHVVTVGIDGSESSAQTLAWAANEAARRHAQLRVVHAFTYPVYGGGLGGAMSPSADELAAIRNHHKQLTEAQVLPVQKLYPQLEIETRVVDVGAVRAITESAQDSDLVVVGSRGVGTVGALFLGSVAHGVLHHAPCPVALIPTSDQPTAVLPAELQRVVVGTDGSPESCAAVRWACDEARRRNVDLTLVHVWDYPYVGPRTGTVEPAELMELDAAEMLARVAREIDGSAERPAHIHAKLRCGSPAGELAQEAGEQDLLVVGGRGRGAIRSALLGSTSASAVNHARGPVVVVPAPKSSR